MFRNPISFLIDGFKLFLGFRKALSDQSETNAKCPKCRSKTIDLIEVWDGAKIVFNVTNGFFDKLKYTEQKGEPVRVEAKCHKCEHGWTIRSISTIDEVALGIPKSIQLKIEDENKS